MMEMWQKEYIRENGTALIDEIDCNVQLVTHLRQCNVLSREEVEKLNAAGNSQGSTSAAYLLLQFLTSRVNGYKVLAQALYHFKQSGPFITLLYGVQINVLNCNPFQYCNIVLSPDDILPKNVLFQGLLVSLKDICSAINFVVLFGIIAENMNASTYQQFMNNDAVVLAKDTIPDKKPYYIPRTLCLNSQLNPAIFQEQTNGIFLIEGIKLAKLSQLTKSFNLPQRHQPISVGSSRKQVYGLTSRFIVLDHHKDYDVIVSKSLLLNEDTRKQIGLSGGELIFYWVQYIDGNFYYVKSSGGRADVQKYTNSSNKVLITQKQFVDRLSECSTPTVLYDSPGMGKTVLLAEFARCIKSIDPSSLVVFLRLPEVIKTLVGDNSVTSRLNHDALKAFIVDQVVTNAFGRTLMTHLIECKGYKVYLFFDGFDEVDEQHIEWAKAFLKCASEITNFKIVLATRPHYSNELENLFGVQGYRILAFQLDDQVSFVLKFWESEYNVTATEQVKAFANHCLESFNKNTSRGERQIAGIPLQCKMLAEIYENEAKRGGNIVPIDCMLNSIYDMYDKFVSKKLSLFCNDKDIDKLFEFHAKAAFELIFPDMFKRTYKNPVARPLDKVYKMGIMEHCQHSSASTHSFVHRTFAEFICAKYVGISLCKNSSVSIFSRPLTVVLMKAILKLKANYFYFDSWRDAINRRQNFFGLSKPFDNVVVVYFLNQFLDQNLSGINNAIVHYSIPRKYRFNLNKLYKFLWASLDCNVLNVFILVLGMCMFPKCVNLQTLVYEFELKQKDMHVIASGGEAYYLREMLLIAAEKSSFRLFKLVSSLVETICKTQWTTICDIESLLKTAAKRGNHQTFEFVLSCRGSANLDALGLLKCCVRESYDDLLEQIIEKCEILECIFECQQLADSLYENQSYGSIMLEPKMHPKLIKILIENKANPAEINDEKENVAHLVARFYSSVDYNEFVKILLSNNFAKVFEMRNHQNQTPIHVALETLDITQRTWETLLEKCNLNISDDSHCSLLSHAVALRRNETVIRDIVAVKNIDKSLYDDFVYLSAEKYNLEAMKYFVVGGGNVNKRHYFGVSTVLGNAIAAKEQSKEMVEFLVQHEVDVNAPFLTSCNCVEEDDFSYCCCCCIFNPLQLADKKENSEVQEVLLNNGAKNHGIRNCCLSSCLNVLILPCNIMRICSLFSLACVCAPCMIICEMCDVNIWKDGTACYNLIGKRLKPCHKQCFAPWDGCTVYYRGCPSL